MKLKTGNNYKVWLSYIQLWVQTLVFYNKTKTGLIYITGCKILPKNTPQKIEKKKQTRKTNFHYALANKVHSKE